MSFKTRDHDVTCLCGLVDLPKRVIVEELPARDGLARFQLQAFVEGPAHSHPETLRDLQRSRKPGGGIFNPGRHAAGGLDDLRHLVLEA